MKKKNRRDGRCFEHPEVVDRDRSRSPIVLRGASSASAHAPRMTAAIARLRAGLEMMQNAINEIADAAAHS